MSHPFSQALAIQKVQIVALDLKQEKQALPSTCQVVHLHKVTKWQVL